MTRPSRRAVMAPTYGRGQHEENCPHDPEPHTIYDRVAAGYRAQLRCGCGKVEMTGNKLYDGHAAADAESRRMIRERR